MCFNAELGQATKSDKAGLGTEKWDHNKTAVPPFEVQPGS